MDVTKVAVWGVRVGWLGLAFSCGPALGSALEGSARMIPSVGSVVLWGGWAVGLVATLLPSPLSLTLLRAGAPAAALAVAAAAAGAGVDAPVGLAWATALTALVMAPAVARYHVNGPAYPNERRHPLRPPGAVLLGPLYLAWLVAVPLPAVGLLLLAGGEVAGAPLLAIGAIGTFLGGRALLRLAKRWLVFVPAGVVLHDHLALSDPVLFPKKQIRAIAPEGGPSRAWDLTLGSAGLSLEVQLKEEADLGKSRLGRGLGQVVKADRILVSPTRPGAVVKEAEARGLPVQRAGAPPRTN